MSFLTDLFDVPKAWLHRWIINGEGEIVYQQQLPKGLFENSEKEEEKHGHKKKEIHEMSRVELSAIALTCNAKELKLVLRKGNDAALISALANPAIDADLIANMLEKSAPSSAVISAIARTRFGKLPQVAAAICKNTKAPLHLARSLIGRLQKTDLKMVMKTPGLSQALKMAARDKLNRKRKKK
jgi:hypothetical protein